MMEMDSHIVILMVAIAVLFQIIMDEGNVVSDLLMVQYAKQYNSVARLPLLP